MGKESRDWYRGEHPHDMLADSGFGAGVKRQDMS